MKIQIKSIAGSILFEGDFSSIADAIRAAIKSSADLSYANLSSADLRSADLSSANLSSADLSSADLRSANLSSANLSSADLRSADLRYADLSSANLSSADLRYADLRSANLSSANLSSADLRYADLRSADLSYANLSSADLRSADLSSIKSDYFDVLLRGKKEVEGLRLAIIEGRVDGSTYEGECACLVGTIANVAKTNFKKLSHLVPDSSRPAERFFLAIKKGDVPKTNCVSKIALEWTDEFIELIKS